MEAGSWLLLLKVRTTDSSEDSEQGLSVSVVWMCFVLQWLMCWGLHLRCAHVRGDETFGRWGLARGS